MFLEGHAGLYSAAAGKRQRCDSATRRRETGDKRILTWSRIACGLAGAILIGEIPLSDIRAGHQAGQPSHPGTQRNAPTAQRCVGEKAVR